MSGEGQVLIIFAACISIPLMLGVWVQYQAMQNMLWIASGGAVRPLLVALSKKTQGNQ